MRCLWVLFSVPAAFGSNVLSPFYPREVHRHPVLESRMVVLASCVEETHRGFGDQEGAV